jgi:hypothetical protein
MVMDGRMFVGVPTPMKRERYCFCFSWVSSQKREKEDLKCREKMGIFTTKLRKWQL